MNILFLSDAIAEHTRRWTQYFALKGHMVDLITFNPKTLDNYDPVRLHVIHKTHLSKNILARLGNGWPILKKIKAVIEETHPDVIHAHTTSSYAWMTMFSGFHPYIVTPWGTDILVNTKKSRLNRLITTMTLKRSDLITTDAYHVKEEIVKFGLPRKKIEIVMFGLDFKRLDKNSDVDRYELRKTFGLGESPVIISTRTLNPIHDVETFIKAIPKIKGSFPEVKFVCLSDGHDRAELEELCRTLRIEKDVVFPGYVSESDMVRWLRISDVYVSTSLTDAGLSASTAEAMACGLPAVITDNADNREWVVDGLGGYLFPNGSSEILAEHVVNLLKEKTKRMEFGRINRHVIEERNNYVTEMARMEDLYKALILQHNNQKT